VRLEAKVDLFDTIEQARKLLGLGEDATRGEIRDAYRRLANRYHPDKSRDKKGNPEKMKEINRAYSIMISYCDSYRFPFSREEVEKMNPELRLRRQFSEDWLTGGK